MVGFLIGFSVAWWRFWHCQYHVRFRKGKNQYYRYQEISGAKNYLILLEFLIEAIVLSLIGCAFGLLLVFALTQVANRTVNFEFVLSVQNVLFGIMLSTILGVIAGIVPAISASRMDPVDAIRSK